MPPGTPPGRLFDAHCHLQDNRLAPRLEAALAEARSHGIRSFLCCGTQAADWPTVAALAAAEPEIVPSLGLHPWHVAARGEDWWDRLRRLLATHRAGVGEIGLDFAIPAVDRTTQETVFLAQYRLSRDLGRPVSLHCRQAWGRLVELLEAEPPHPAGVVLHSYSGAAELIPRFLAVNAFFSYSGVVTKHHYRRVRKACAATPDDRLLIETDAPDLPPLPVMGTSGAPVINEPANLVYVLNEVATIRGTPPATLAALTTANAERVFASLLNANSKD